MAYFFQTSFINAVAFVLIAACCISAQQLKPVLDDDQVETTNLEIQKIYNLTEVARNVADFERIINRSEKLLEQDISEKMPST